ncbi:MAG: hypothetical protein V1729_04470 [Candidatus Woesearchaeota archaeon]
MKMYDFLRGVTAAAGAVAMGASVLETGLAREISDTLVNGRQPLELLIECALAGSSVVAGFALSQYAVDSVRDYVTYRRLK